MKRSNLIVPAQREQLLADLRERTGLPVKRVDVGRIDFLRDTAELKVYYDEPRNGGARRAGKPSPMNWPLAIRRIRNSESASAAL